MVAPRAAMPSVVSSKRASLPAPPSRTNSPSPTSRRRHERTCSALWPHASATAYRWEAATVPSSPTIPKTSVLVGISTVGSATIVILTTGTKGVKRSGGERLPEAVGVEQTGGGVVGRPGDLLTGRRVHEVGAV